MTPNEIRSAESANPRILTRRQLLAVTTTLATAGCSSIGGSSTPTPEETDAVVFTERRRTTIPEGEYLSFEFGSEAVPQLQVYYEVGVIGDGQINVFLLDMENYDRYTAGQTVAYVSGELNVDDNRSEETVPADKYAVVFGNTDRGENPTTDVTVEFTIEVSQA
ncbi:hypothetical protein LPA44_14420 [Halobacterium sp. KA-4]|uniref:hypothetical protein n=1 Tax=Halobacterium sp. KA-4 TaxID=2896367 RepID=UPI001E5233A8|nr:hypothetical protein [Halobacterium sp. KA-4]MCD2201077.1 hypothetical protein [Halobacterium sp. KA-4]